MLPGVDAAEWLEEHRQGRVHLPNLLAEYLPLFFYGIFERWFLVPLPKGPLEALLGL